ncbi:hypothetical protein RRF57_012301 [Xylaria bambusicola]|uniref:Uncharacterized protein n=1 Tax=Xylaria bambusicola TaxID=326684 RepID=A0AAN7V5H0_9PEZI
MPLETISYSTENEEFVAPQQYYSNNVIVQCSINHSQSLSSCRTNPCTALKGCLGKDIAVVLLLGNHLNGEESTDLPSFLGANSTVHHRYDELTTALTKRNATHPHKHKKKPLSHPPRNLYVEIVVPVLAVTLLIGLFFIFFARRRIQQQKIQQQRERGNNQTSSMEMGALRPRQDINDDTKASPPTTGMGILSRQGSGSSATFTRPRPAPFPPPVSPPPNRPLPPIPVQKAKHPPVVAEGHGGGDDIEMLPQWHLVCKTAESSSSS